MNHFKDFQTQLSKKIKNASDFERILFGLDICKRLFPDYEYFELKCRWGNSKLLNEAIKFIEIHKDGEKNNSKRLDLIIDLVDKIIPDTEDFSCIEVSYALNASASVLELLSYLKDKNHNHIIAISSLMFDNVDFKIRDNNDGITNKEVEKHPLIVKEWEYQFNLINNGAQQPVYAMLAFWLKEKFCKKKQ
jgi:uncharacterized protein